MTWATVQEWQDAVDDFAADHPLEALRELADVVSPYRLDCCAVAEPAAALIHAHDLLTPERRRWCEQQAQWADVQRRFLPDRLEPERRRLLRERAS